MPSTHFSPRSWRTFLQLSSGNWSRCIAVCDSRNGFTRPTTPTFSETCCAFSFYICEARKTKKKKPSILPLPCANFWGTQENREVSVLLLHESVHKHGPCQHVPTGLNAAQPQHAHSKQRERGGEKAPDVEAENGSCWNEHSLQYQSALYCCGGQM